MSSLNMLGAKIQINRKTA